VGHDLSLALSPAERLASVILIGSMTLGSRTDTAFWDDYWASLELPLEVEKSSSLLLRAITDVFDRFLDGRPRLSVLEIGGAPGQYAAYVHRLGHAVTVLDSSPMGCEKARENFDLLGLNAEVVAGDMFEPPADLPRFDVVYSLGLIEHFQNVADAVRAHTSFVAPGGLLILGVPNLRGLNEFLMRRLSPAFLARHELNAMAEPTWDEFEALVGLVRLYREYIGGFEAATFWRCDSRRLSDRLLHRALWYAGKALGRDELRFLRRANSSSWSAYLMGVYAVPGPA
jgi:2-polyprenyl-3-methyl-5-hydroxy-6-metoxy-1,4-benzoquinol methylase